MFPDIDSLKNQKHDIENCKYQVASQFYFVCESLGTETISDRLDAFFKAKRALTFNKFDRTPYSDLSTSTISVWGVSKKITRDSSLLFCDLATIFAITKRIKGDGMIYVLCQQDECLGNTGDKESEKSQNVLRIIHASKIGTTTIEQVKQLAELIASYSDNSEDTPFTIEDIAKAISPCITDKRNSCIEREYEYVSETIKKLMGQTKMHYALHTLPWVAHIIQNTEFVLESLDNRKSYTYNFWLDKASTSNLHPYKALLDVEDIDIDEPIHETTITAESLSHKENKLLSVYLRDSNCIVVFTESISETATLLNIVNCLGFEKNHETLLKYAVINAVCHAMLDETKKVSFYPKVYLQDTASALNTLESLWATAMEVSVANSMTLDFLKEFEGENSIYSEIAKLFIENYQPEIFSFGVKQNANRIDWYRWKEMKDFMQKSANPYVFARNAVKWYVDFIEEKKTYSRPYYECIFTL